MKKSKIPTREEVAAQGIVSLETNPLCPDDRTLPHPRGYIGSRKQKSPSEASRLAQTRVNQGLVPERVSTQYWQCPDCGLISESCQCCGVLGNQVSDLHFLPG